MKLVFTFHDGSNAKFDGVTNLIKSSDHWRFRLPDGSRRMLMLRYVVMITEVDS